MRWSKAFSKTGLLALMLAVVGSGIFFYERQYCGAEQPARYEPQQLRQVITADSKTSRTIRRRRRKAMPGWNISCRAKMSFTGCGRRAKNLQQIQGRFISKV